MVQDTVTEFVVPELAERVDAVGLSTGVAGFSLFPQEINNTTDAIVINDMNHFTFFICENSPINKEELDLTSHNLQIEYC